MDDSGWSTAPRANRSDNCEIVAAEYGSIYTPCVSNRGSQTLASLIWILLLVTVASLFLDIGGAATLGPSTPTENIDRSNVAAMASTRGFVTADDDNDDDEMSAEKLALHEGFLLGKLGGAKTTTLKTTLKQRLKRRIVDDISQRRVRRRAMMSPLRLAVSAEAALVVAERPTPTPLVDYTTRTTPFWHYVRGSNDSTAEHHTTITTTRNEQSGVTLSATVDHTRSAPTKRRTAAAIAHSAESALMSERPSGDRYRADKSLPTAAAHRQARVEIHDAHDLPPPELDESAVILYNDDEGETDWRDKLKIIDAPHDYYDSTTVGVDVENSENVNGNEHEADGEEDDPAVRGEHRDSNYNNRSEYSSLLLLQRSNSRRNATFNVFINDSTHAKMPASKSTIAEEEAEGEITKAERKKAEEKKEKTHKPNAEEEERNQYESVGKVTSPTSSSLRKHGDQHEREVPPIALPADVSKRDNFLLPETKGKPPQTVLNPVKLVKAKGREPLEKEKKASDNAI